MSVSVDYRLFIEDSFWIKDRYGLLVPFYLNEVQDHYDTTLQADYPYMQAIRENILKGRQFGLSSYITGLFATDFILSELGELPIIDSDVYSHKDDETTVHIARFNLFLNSWLIKSQGGTLEDMEREDEILRLRKAFLKVDNGGEIVSRRRGAQYHAQTASAKVSGRGGTKQNIHWSEVAFYPNTEIMSAKKLVVGAEKQVPHGFGKIFRETTGNMAGDYFHGEYKSSQLPGSLFKSRFYPWYMMPTYKTTALPSWNVPLYYKPLIDSHKATVEQAYWHFQATKELEDKEELREYPTYENEAFLMGGRTFFQRDALIFHMNRIKSPIKEGTYVNSIA
jgi:hypothetical protein